MCVEYKKWMQRLADGVDLAEEVLPGVPIVELAGSNRVLIERHDGMTEYSRERIYVKVSYGVVCVCGSELMLIKMTRDQLVIAGKIDGVHLCRRS